MQTISKALYKLFDDHMGLYDNPHDIEFIMHLDGTLTLGSAWPGFECEEHMIFQLSYECSDINAFLTDFNIHSIEQIDGITHTTIKELYYKGKAEVYSAIDVRDIYYALYFKRKNEQLFATDDNGLEFEVTGLPETPLCFIEYTQSQFYLATAY